VAAGQFAYVFKLNIAHKGEAKAVRCFRGFIADREQRYRAISEHLKTVVDSPLARFEYHPAGILVEGRRYPIVVMDWVSGLSLDSYIAHVLDRRDVLRDLAEDWIRVLRRLREARIAHGDLQHGNILVENGLLRLVDFDGMYVPAMAGWTACENGHEHYQHPRKTAKDFGPNVDNFSGLVIYLSLLALSEDPELWRDYHDENLIFTKHDFLAPANSALFRRLRILSEEPRRLADVLSKACETAPLDCPSVVDIVPRRSKLPAWMRNPPGVPPVTASREAVTGGGSFGGSFSEAGKGGVLGTAGLSQGSTMPAPASGGISAGSSSNAGAQSAGGSTLFLALLSKETFEAGVLYALLGLALKDIWFPVLKGVFGWLGSTASSASWLAVAAYYILCHCLAFITLKGVDSRSPKANLQSGSGAPAPTSQVLQGRAVPPPSSSVAYVGNKMRRIYHQPNCKWAKRLGVRNRVLFRSQREALDQGYRSCRVCHP
jgi:hypothetical protein